MIGRAWMLLLLAVGMSVQFSLQWASASPDTVVIGSKNFTEQTILGEIIAQALEEQTSLKVQRRFDLGGVLFTFEALRAGEIDLYPEYTGTGLLTILKTTGPVQPDAVYRQVQQAFMERYQMAWSRPLGFNNTYAIAVRRNDTRLKDVQTISQLAKVSKGLRLGLPHEFMVRPDGYLYLKHRYPLRFAQKDIVGLNPGLMYMALQQGEVDAIVAFSTDGRIPAFNLRLLEDDKQIFPPYEAAVLVRKAVAQRYPQLMPALNRLAGTISNARMQRMNYQVDALGITPAQVARQFLMEQGIVQSDIQQQQISPDPSAAGFWNYLFTQRHDLVRLVIRHLFLTFTALGLAILLSVPAGIMLTRLPKMANLVFGVLNVFQTVPSLALLGFLIPFMGIGAKPAILALLLYSLLPIISNTYTGIRQVDEQLKEACRGLGLTEGQILRKVELPLAMPFMMTGIRISTVLIVGTATLAALIGAGGLGEPIFRGISSVNPHVILSGAIPAAVLAILMDRGLLWVERLLQQKYHLPQRS